MERKEVNPDSKKTSGGFLKRFAIGVLGGIVGALITVGAFYLLNGSGSNPTNNAGNTNDKGETVVSNVKVNADSDITEAVDKVQDAVVSVINLQKQSQSSELGPWGGLFGQDEGTENSEGSDDSGEMQESSEGSGVIYKKDGNSAYVVTNNHVVEGQDGLEVVLKDGTKVTAELVGTDAYTDLAVLKISSDKVDTVATFGDSSELKVGEPAIAIGSPLGSQYANSVTSGIVSSLNRQVSNTTESGEAVNINAIQTDAAINPGNSGGPLVNIEGQVIGINSSKIASTSSSASNVSVEGMGFAIPSNDVVTIINQLEKDGKVTRPALGITMRDLSTISSQQQEQILKVPSSLKNGVVVLSVVNATPAEKAGLKQYDVITKIDGKEVTSTTDLQAALYKKKVGDSIEITFYRESKEQTVTAELSIDQSTLQKSQNN
ncbi:S1C family serine protease [Enterococcus mediterraneensis]|uniref:S1C family serine protease n=1 Tax=Enterococcus mediterraneensis TaxID=2364791 RepID=UPI000F05489E|nr:trypsin-like peptidase domain-containing protein [Enterococcus mediterraneensis]